MRPDRRTLDKLKGLPTVMANVYSSVAMELPEIDFMEDFKPYFKPLNKNSMSNSTRSAVKIGC